MADLTMIVTNAGRAALVNAANTGTAPVTIASVGISATATTPTVATATLPGEIKRIATISGDVVADDTIHLVVRDDSAAIYTVRSIALYLADGTLFASYGQAAVILEKSAMALMLLAIDVRFADVAATTLTFGNANFLNPPATETAPGVGRLATPPEAAAGTSLTTLLSPKRAKDALLAWLGYAPVNKAGDTMSGPLVATLIGGAGSAIVSRGGPADAEGGQLTLGYAGAGNIIGQANGTWNLDVAGNNHLRIFRQRASGAVSVDLSIAETTGAATLVATPNVAGSTMWYAGNDGAGSGLDADLLDGQDSSFFTNITGRLGYTPVRQGGGPGQQGNGISIGWSGATLKAAVDGSDMGVVWTSATDGAGSGLDADLLDGQQGGWYADITSRLGYTPANRAGDTFTGPLIGPIIGAAGTILVSRGGSAEGGQLTLGYAGATSITGPGYGTWSIDVDASNRLRFYHQRASGVVTEDIVLSEVTGAATLVATPNVAGSTMWHAGNDGAGSGLDADLLDGQDSSFFTNITGRLGYTPVRQGGGPGQQGNSVSIGWSGATLKAAVDGSDLGVVWTSATDGAGSGLDADLLDGQQGGWYADITGRLGYTPVNRAGDTFLGPVSIARTGSATIELNSAGVVVATLAAQPDGNVVLYRGIGGPLASVFSVPGQAGPFDVAMPLTRQGNKVWDVGNDGAGSGLDADLLDGQQGSWYADVPGRLGYNPLNRAGDTINGQFDVDNGTGGHVRLSTGGDITAWRAGGATGALFLGSSGGRYLFYDGSRYQLGGADLYISGAKAWTAGNDGSGSGLDADLLDGKEAGDFVLTADIDRIETNDRTTPGVDSVTVPSWARRAEVHIVGGGGGGGGGGGSFSGGGGGAGGYAFGTVNVTPGATLTRTVGGGGGGGGSPGGDGGPSGLTGVGSATGGSGGLAAADTCAGGGGGVGSGVNGIRGFPGGTGGDGNSASAKTQGGSGAPGPFGGGARSGSGSGIAGQAPGSGGGGVWNSPGVGGAGAPGAVLIRWLP